MIVISSWRLLTLARIFSKFFNQGKVGKKRAMSDPRLHTEGAENTFAHEGLNMLLYTFLHC